MTKEQLEDLYHIALMAEGEISFVISSFRKDPPDMFKAGYACSAVEDAIKELRIALSKELKERGAANETI
jgi:hypothetical protein